MEVRLELEDFSYKAIVRGLLLTGQGPRDPLGRDATLRDWITGQTACNSFRAYCYAQQWTLAQVLSFLEYQCCYMFADGLDEQEFAEEWPIFFQILKKQKLLNNRAFVPYQPPTKQADGSTVAGMIELEMEL